LQILDELRYVRIGPGQQVPGDIAVRRATDWRFQSNDGATNTV
jgi:hypothetical protein